MLRLLLLVVVVVLVVVGGRGKELFLSIAAASIE
jgi:hypothetical protein